MKMLCLALCILSVFLAVTNLVLNHFWQKKWFGVLTILSYLCPLPFLLLCFYDVAHRAEVGDISGLLDIYPGIARGFILLFAVITVLNVAALLLKGKGRVHLQ